MEEAEWYAELDPPQVDQSIDPEIHEACVRCDVHISYVDRAYVCERNCTHCPECTEILGQQCTNCGGELRLRARQTKPIGR